jgi:chemotaxis family two-component system response regulator Rcp1
MDQEIVDKKTVLLIESDPTCAAIVTRTLEEMSSLGNLEVARDGENVLTLLRQSPRNRPGLILLDLDRPEGDAFAFLEAIKADPTLRMIPVVVLSDSDDAEKIAACYNAGAVGYLVKSDDGPGFSEKIRNVCGYWALSRVPVA